MSGRLIGVVGPSGVGKDTVMQGIAATSPGIELVHRTITRAPDLGSEDFDAVDEVTFQRMKQTGSFCVDWAAHGLRYGIPRDVPLRVAAGDVLLVNLSRGVLREVAALVPAFSVLNVTASPGVLAQRLAARGRESEQDIAQRLSRAAAQLPGDLNIITIRNDGSVAQAVDAALHVLSLEQV